MGTAIITKKEEAIASLKSIIAKGGPEKREYPRLESSIAVLADLIEDRLLTPEEMNGLLGSCGFLFDKTSVMGHIKMKPHGYAGDYEIIERIYQEEIRHDGHRQWDIYSLQHPAAAAVRNRKRYFTDLIADRLNEKGTLRLCNVASGPGRDLLEAYDQLAPGHTLRTTCVEMDGNAIDYARRLTARYSSDIDFIRKNVFRFHTEERFDLVWSAGLFDYFNDDAFKLLIQRFRQWLKPGGEIVIGNFNEVHNPSRRFMELFGEWHLTHRSPEELCCLAMEAGFKKENIRVGREAENINLFLHLKYDA